MASWSFSMAAKAICFWANSSVRAVTLSAIDPWFSAPFCSSCSNSARFAESSSTSWAEVRPWFFSSSTRAVRASNSRRDCSPSSSASRTLMSMRRSSAFAAARSSLAVLASASTPATRALMVFASWRRAARRPSCSFALPARLRASACSFSISPRRLRMPAFLPT